MNVLITGGAGFIGSHLVQNLLADTRVHMVRVMDNLITGSLKNIEPFFTNPKFEFLQTDISHYPSCVEATKNIHAILHQAALGSVPRSIKDPLTTNHINITGTLNIFTAAKEAGIKRVVYAASSSTYGDHAALPKVEHIIGRPLSPYAVTKWVNELYAQVFADLYTMEFIGLRYFNIFGPGQNPQGPYAAVIPLFITNILNHKASIINGDGSISRDFTFVQNAVQANVLALFTQNPQALNQVYNIACGKQTTLLQLYNYLKELSGSTLEATLGNERTGDIKHSLADISKAQTLLGYTVQEDIQTGLQKTLNWYKETKL